MRFMLKISGVLLLLVISVWALILMAMVNTLSLIVSMVLIVALIGALVFELKTSKPLKLGLMTLIKIASLMFAGLMTYYISDILNPILGAALIGLIGAMLFNDYKEAIYVGAFVGMSGIFTVALLLLVLVLAALIYVLLDHQLEGLGGKLGSIAFIATFIVSRLSSPMGSTVSFNFLEYIYLLIMSVASSLVTYVLNKHLNNTTLSSSFIGLLLGVVLLFNKTPFVLYLCLVGYGATFIGMQTRYKFYTIPIASLLFVVLYSFHVFNGLGGLLGFLAFLSLLPIVCINHLIKGVKVWKKSPLSLDQNTVLD